MHCSAKLKNILKNSLSSLANEHLGMTIDSQIVADLLDIIIKQEINTKLSEGERTRYCIDTFQKELLCLAILVDRHKDNEMFRTNNEVSTSLRRIFA